MAEFVKEGSLFVPNADPGPASQGGCLLDGECYGYCDQYKYNGNGISMISFRNCIHFDSPPIEQKEK